MKNLPKKQTLLERFQGIAKGNAAGLYESDDMRARVLFSAGAVCSEAGEVFDVVKKAVNKDLYFAGKPEKEPHRFLDAMTRATKERLCEEAGDLLFYLTLLLSDHGLTIESAIESQIEKLEKDDRYNKKEAF